MIATLKIKGFKSLWDVDLDLGSVNIFIGGNGSGKSNLLEAVGVLGATTFGVVEPETLRYRGVRIGQLESYKSSFADRDDRWLILEANSAGAPDSLGAKYRVNFGGIGHAEEIKWRIAEEHLSNNGRKMLLRDHRACILYALDRPGEQPVRLSEYQSAAILSLRIQESDLEPVTSLLSELEGFAIYTPNTLVLRGIADDIARDPMGLGGSGLAKVVEGMIDLQKRSLGPFDLEDVWELIEWADGVSAHASSSLSVSPGIRTAPEVLVFADRYMKRGQKFLTAYDVSEGALYVLFMMALIGHESSPKVFAIDNFDQALHPRLALALTKLIADQIVRDGTRQMLATTHNPLVLDGLDLTDDRIRLFAVDRDQNGATVVNRVQVTPELMAQTEQGLSLSRLWTMGRLGGTPNLW